MDVLSQQSNLIKGKNNFLQNTYVVGDRPEKKSRRLLDTVEGTFKFMSVPLD